MSAEDVVKSAGTALVFSAIAWLSDMISAGLAFLQQAIGSTLMSALGNPIGALIGAVGGLAVWIFDSLGGTNIIEPIQGLLGAIFGVQMFVSLFTLCVFYAIVLASPKGTYSIVDCLVAAGIFLLESIPFLCGFTAWGWFAAYLRRKEVSGITEKLTSAAGLQEGAAGGVVSKALKAVKK